MMTMSAYDDNECLSRMRIQAYPCWQLLIPHAGQDLPILVISCPACWSGSPMLARACPTCGFADAGVVLLADGCVCRGRHAQMCSPSQAHPC